MAFSAMSYFVFGEVVTAARINNFIDNDNALRDGSGIAASAITPEKLLTGAGTSWVWQAYTPTWTASSSNPSLGNGTLAGAYIQIGKTIIFKVILTMGSTTTYGSGNYSFALPVTASTTAVTLGRNAIGTAYLLDDSGGAELPAWTRLETTTTARIMKGTVSGANVLAGIVTEGAPIAWATSDKISLQGIYEAA